MDSSIHRCGRKKAQEKFSRGRREAIDDHCHRSWKAPKMCPSIMYSELWAKPITKSSANSYPNSKSITSEISCARSPVVPFWISAVLPVRDAHNWAVARRMIAVTRPIRAFRWIWMERKHHRYADFFFLKSSDKYISRHQLINYS